MNRRTVRLVERRGRDVWLPRADVDFLLATARDVIDVQPAFQPGVFRLTPRGYVGVLDGPTRRFEIHPKLPWPNLSMLLGLAERTAPQGESMDARPDLLAVLARELAWQIVAITRLGLIRGYQEREIESAYLRGRLRVTEQLKDVAARAFTDRFHITESAFGLDTPWNRIPKVVASRLLSRPDLPSPVRHLLADTIAPLAEVPAQAIDEADFELATREQRAAAYNELISLCRLIWDGLTAAELTAGRAGGFLLDLGQVFERYVIAEMCEAVAGARAWAADGQARMPLGRLDARDIVLQPDLIIRRNGVVRVVLDAKWKRPKLDPADLHQVLAYAAITGAPHVALVYPGRRTSLRELIIGEQRLRVSLIRLQVLGTVASCRESTNRIVRYIRRTDRRGDGRADRAGPR